MARFITRWEPMRDFVTLRGAMDQLFEESFVQPNWVALSRRSNDSDATWRLPLDVYATDEEVVIQASVPGVKPDEVEITFENDILSIRGEFPAPLENVEYEMRERRFGRFGRNLNFNIPVDAARIEATFENGVLTIVVPKAESIKPKTIKVQVK